MKKISELEKKTIDNIISLCILAEEQAIDHERIIHRTIPYGSDVHNTAVAGFEAYRDTLHRILKLAEAERSFRARSSRQLPPFLKPPVRPEYTEEDERLIAGAVECLYSVSFSPVPED